MNRNGLRVVIALGALITLLGGTGIFAVFNDEATTGTSNVTSGARPKAADLQIAMGVLVPPPTGIETIRIDCGLDATRPWGDNVTDDLFTVVNAQPGDDLGRQYLCLRNVGSAPLALTASVIDLVDNDVDCTGDEAAAGDATCGFDHQVIAMPQAGELSPLIQIDMTRVMCADVNQAYVDYGNQSLDNFTAFNFGGDTALLPNEVACVVIHATYPSPASEAAAQIAQSDQATWRFAFDGTVTN